MTLYRCPFCGFDRSMKHGPNPDYSAVQALRELTVHLVFLHPENFRELAQHVSDEWDSLPRTKPDCGDHYIAGYRAALAAPPRKETPE